MEYLESITQQGNVNFNEATKKFIYVLEELKQENPKEFSEKYSNFLLLDYFPELLEEVYSPLPPQLTGDTQEKLLQTKRCSVSR